MIILLYDKFKRTGQAFSKRPADYEVFDTEEELLEFLDNSDNIHVLYIIEGKQKNVGYKLVDKMKKVVGRKYSVVEE